VPKAVLGFRSKTGRAIAVALAGNRKNPQFLLRREVSLYDPKVPASGQPFHEVMELPWNQATVAVLEFVKIVERVAAESFAEIADEVRARGFEVKAAGVVGSPDSDLERIGNLHIRAHAAEGMTFRQVLEHAAAKHAIDCHSFSDRTIASLEPVDVMKALGRAAGRPWRADERAAATAAWMVL
jgi:hypothetical protein